MRTFILSLTIASLFLVFSSVGTARDPSLVAYYPFDEGAGDKTEDKSGNNNTGTLMKSPTWTKDGKYGNAISFDGVDDYVDCGSNSSLRIPSNVTVEAWAKAINVTSTQFVAGVPYSDQAGWNNPWVGHQIGFTGGLMIAFLNVDKVYGDFRGGSPQAGEWTHIALTFDGTRRRAYVNGEEVFADDSVSGKIQFEGTPHFVIGIRSITAPGEYFGGVIDEVALYNRALTQEEIQRDMEGIFKTVTAVEPKGNFAMTWGDLKMR
jgi:hypothetical protein